MRAVAVGAAVLGVVLFAVGDGTGGHRWPPREVTPAAAPAPVPASPARSASLPGPAATVSPEALTAVVQRYCQTCHNDQLLTGNLSLQGFDVKAAASRAEAAEKMVVKLRAGMMPPPGMPRPAGDTLLELVQTLETIVDEAARRRPNPGARRFQRLNRAEYARVIGDLLALEVDAGKWLPLDTYLANFDNMSDAQALSPTLLDAYMKAATDISRLAVGNAASEVVVAKYATPYEISQHAWDHVEGTPFGTRGGTAVVHDFPADGEYVFTVETLPGKGSRFEDLDISVDGERVALLGVEPVVLTPVASGPVFVRSGQHRVAAAFVRKAEGPYDDLLRPHDWSLAGGRTTDDWADYGITALPHLSQLTITGPHHPTGVSETASRRKVFSCRPASPAEERPCAEAIVARLAGEAYRRPVSAEDLDGLLSLYETATADGGFEVGVRTALQAILMSPFFLFRFEREPEGVRPGQPFALADVDLASRLSFFLWGTAPDAELLDVARTGRLARDEVLERQVARMLADPRSKALSTRFAAQWLRLQDLQKVQPEPYFFPNYDRRLAVAMRRETELFFDHLVREDRSVLELFSADYTFVDERLARHYGIPDVSGSEFRRVAYPDASRRGLLGHGSVLVLTSMANRTSPVLRGKWVMEVLLGTPPPPPPPGVPDLEETAGTKDGRFLTTRERMEMHRKSTICSSCHQYMDPIGLALDNFDVTGRWRIRENGMPLDTKGVFYDGTPVSTPAELTGALLRRPVPLVRNFTENLLAYAMGRRVEYFDKPAVREIARAAAENDYWLSSFILGVVKSEPFRMKRAAATADGGPSGS